MKGGLGCGSGERSKEGQCGTSRAASQDGACSSGGTDPPKAKAAATSLADATTTGTALKAGGREAGEWSRVRMAS